MILIFEPVLGIEYFYYGSYFENIKKNNEESRKYYIQGSKLKCIYSMTMMGNLYQKKEQYDKAIKYHKRSGLSISLKKLGDIYSDNFKDYETAKKYYLEAINLGDVRAMYALGYQYDIIHKDYEMAIKYYEMASNSGDSLNNLGYIYQHIYNDYDKAKHYYILSSNLDCISAYYNLGCLYEEKDNNIKMAKECYLKTIKLDNESVYAIYRLGVIYSEKNKIRAKRYFQMSANLGDADSMFELYELYLEECDLVNAEKYLILAYENGLEDTTYTLAKFYHVHKNNMELSEKYYKLCIDHNPKAVDKLLHLYVHYNKYVEAFILVSTHKKESSPELLKILFQNEICC